MSLSNELISQFVKATNDTKKKTNTESTVYGTIVEYEGTRYVRIDGSDRLTPVTTTADTVPGERVTVMVKNHSATVTGNISSPAARVDDIDDVSSIVDKIEEFEIVVATKVSSTDFDAQTARIDDLTMDNVTIKKQLTAVEGDIDNLQANTLQVTERLTAAEADIDKLESTIINTEILDAKYATIENLNATNADLNNLESTYADFEVASTNKFTAVESSIESLQTDKLDATAAEITYAKISDLNSATAEITNLESTFGDFQVATTDKLTATDASIEELQTNLANNYYTKTQSDALIKVESDKISSAVTRIGNNETAISTLQQTADGLEVRLDTTDSNVTKAQTTADTANTTANSVKTDLANNYTKKSLPDTRNDNQIPSWYFTNYPKQIITEFKLCTAIGLYGVGSYCTLETIVPWTDSSGGYPKQTAKVESTGKEYWRVGASADTWSNWIDPYGLAMTANTNASTAQTTANTARTEAANAAKTATNYLGFSSDGLVVGDMTASTLGKNVLIDSDSVDIRNGSTVLASFEGNAITLGQNSADSVINLCDGAGTISALVSESSSSYPAYDSMELTTQKLVIAGQKTEINTTGSGTSYTNNANISALSYQTSAGGFAGLGADCTTVSSGDKNQTGVSANATSNSTSTHTDIYAEAWDESANSWQSNRVSVYPLRTQFSQPITINGNRITGANKVLWSGGYYMSSGHSCTLSEAISVQTNGIVLVFSEYVDEAISNTAFHSRFVPKKLVASHAGTGHCIQLSSYNLSYFATKYLYISDTKISGHDDNVLAGSSTCGITRTGKRFVLRYVIGV